MRLWGRRVLLAASVAIAVTGTVAAATVGTARARPTASRRPAPLAAAEPLPTPMPTTPATVAPASLPPVRATAAKPAGMVRVGPAPVAPRPVVAATPPGPPWYEVRGDAALARITYPWQRLGFSIAFFGPRAGLFGKTNPAQHRIEVYVRPDEDDLLLEHMIAHELGHAVDVTYNDDARRSQWLQERGIDPSTPWFGCSLCTDYQTPAGDFAETFALWQVGPRDYRSRMAPAPTPDQLQALLPLFSAP